MNTPYTPTQIALTDEDVEAWRDYETLNAVAKHDYIIRPSARPWVGHHYYCMCCDTLTVQTSTVCLSCQERSPRWRAFANDPESVALARYVNRRAPSALRGTES